MSKVKECSRRLLAGSCGARVEHCSCGHVHITVGPVTMRMEESAYRDFVTVAARGLLNLDDAPSAVASGQRSLSLVPPLPH